MSVKRIYGFNFQLATDDITDIFPSKKAIKSHGNRDSCMSVSM